MQMTLFVASLTKILEKWPSADRAIEDCEGIGHYLSSLTKQCDLEGRDVSVDDHNCRDTRYRIHALYSFHKDWKVQAHYPFINMPTG